MFFHLGKPIAAMLLISLVTGAAMLFRSPQKRKDVVFWTFADHHARTYQGERYGGKRPGDPPTLAELFELRTGLTLGIELLSGRAENVRLPQMFMSDMKGPVVPDAVEIEISTVGRYFRAPVGEVGFLPLNDLLRQSGWMDKVVKTRFAPWSKEGVIFGVPHDVHPVTMAYREDLFREAGVDLSESKTWPEFQENCLKFQRYWSEKGRPRHALELPLLDSGYLTVMLLQQHINPIDDFNRIHLRDPRVAKTVAFYSQLVVGPRKIAGQSSGSEGAASKDLNEGDICAFFAPDWRVRILKDYTATDPVTNRKILEGKMRMMPLPIFNPGDSRTATWGGTMAGIPRAAARPEAAWQLIELLYLSDEGLDARLRETSILPPVKEQWNHPAFQQPDPYFGGQYVNRLYVELAGELPARYVSPAATIAASLMAAVMNNAENHVKAKGTDGLEEACAQWLGEAADDLERRIRHGAFDEVSIGGKD